MPLPGKLQLHLPLVHAGANNADPPLGTQLHEYGKGLRERLLIVVVRVMRVEDIHALQAQPFERCGKRLCGHHAG